MLKRLEIPIEPKPPKLDVFGCPAGKLSKDQELRSSGIKFFRKGSDDPHLGRIETPAEDRGFLIGVSQGRGHRRRIFHEFHATNHDFEEGSIYIRNLGEAYRADMHGAFDFLLMEVSRPFLAELAQEHGRRAAGDLICRPGERDLVLSRLLRVIEPMLDGNSKASPLFLDQFGTAIGIHLLERYGNAEQPAAAARRTRLSRAQLASALEMLTGNLSIADVARACGLSRGYFIRGFKEATGETPHQWTLSQRVERARGLLMTSDLSLADIALACGFADQSHFTRVFARAAGSPPGSWRRTARG